VIGPICAGARRLLGGALLSAFPLKLSFFTQFMLSLTFFECLAWFCDGSTSILIRTETELRRIKGFVRNFLWA
jgi:hypothetical protein